MGLLEKINEKQFQNKLLKKSCAVCKTHFMEMNY